MVFVSIFYSKYTFRWSKLMSVMFGRGRGCCRVYLFIFTLKNEKNIIFICWMLVFKTLTKNVLSIKVTHPLIIYLLFQRDEAEGRQQHFKFKLLPDTKKVAKCSMYVKILSIKFCRNYQIYSYRSPKCISPLLELN